MLKKTRDLYDALKLKRKTEPMSVPEGETPITHIKIFHKEYPRIPSMKLPEVKTRGELEELFESRKSSREFSESPLKISDLALILGSCKINEKENYFERRPYPSAGARFPIEIYPVVFNVKGLEGGAYHYNLDKHSLELLLGKNLRDVSADFVSPFVQNPSIAIIMTAVISRTEAKYGHRAYPFALIEAGHIGQNIYLLSEKHNIGCCAVGGYIDETIQEVLDLTDDELPVYSVALGKKSGK